MGNGGTAGDSIVNKLRQFREKHGMTQLDIAVATGQHPAALSRLERGVRCTQNTALKIAAAFDEDVLEVFPDFDTYRGGEA